METKVVKNVVLEDGKELGKCTVTTNDYWCIINVHGNPEEGIDKNDFIVPAVKIARIDL